MDRQVENNIIGFLAILTLLLFYGWSVTHKIPVSTQLTYGNTEVTYQGKQFVLYTLIGVGKTNKNRVPVYQLGFIPKEQQKNAF